MRIIPTEKAVMRTVVRKFGGTLTKIEMQNMRPQHGASTLSVIFEHETPAQRNAAKAMIEGFGDKLAAKGLGWNAAHEGATGLRASVTSEDFGKQRSERT